MERRILLVMIWNNEQLFESENWNLKCHWAENGSKFCDCANKDPILSLMHHYSEKNEFATSDIFTSVSFLALHKILSILSLIETNNMGLDVTMRGDGGGLLTFLDDGTDSINDEDSTGIYGISIIGGINVDAALAWKGDAS